MRMFIIGLVLFVSILSIPGFTQTYHVDLNKIDKLDDQGLLLEILNKDSTGKTISPDLTNSIKYFLPLEYNLHNQRQSKNNNTMIVPRETADLVYLDYNNNDNFTDDGEPLIFSKDKNELVVNFHTSDTDTDCISQFAILRKPVMPDSVQRTFVEANGDLYSNFLKFAAPLKGKPDFKGKAGSFYFIDQNNLSRGTLQLDGKSFAIGLYDYTKNGLYNDSTDLLMINLNGGEDLNLTVASCVFKINDVLQISSGNYRVMNCDKYGRWVDLVKTNESATSLYRTDPAYQIGSTKAFHASQIDDTLWQISGTTIFGEKIELSKYKGNYVLLNFWGEWCRGCVNELPELTEIENKFHQKNFKIVSFIQPANKDKAIKMIKDKNLDWPQIILDKATVKKFNIEGFPTNILILPDGKTCYITNDVNRKSLDQYVK